MPSNLFEKKIERGSYFYKMAHKVSIIAMETKEHLQFFDIGDSSPLLNCLSFFKYRAWQYHLRWYILSILI